MGSGKGHDAAPMDPDEPVTWRDLLAEATERLGEGGQVADARRIVEEASGAGAAELALVLEDPVTEGGMARFDAMLARREKGEPLQYVLGHWGFRQLDLMVDHRVLIPRPETEQVVEIALDELDRLGGREVSTNVVDLGTGSGAIALSIATERVRTAVWATDASPDALEVARANLVGAGRVAARVTIAAGHWYAALPASQRGGFHLIVSNPPYVATSVKLPAEVADWEPSLALLSGPDGLEDLRRIISGAPEWLESEGVLVCELSPEQADAAADLAARRFQHVRIESDLTGRARALVARVAQASSGTVSG